MPTRPNDLEKNGGFGDKSMSFGRHYCGDGNDGLVLERVHISSFTSRILVYVYA